VGGERCALAGSPPPVAHLFSIFSPCESRTHDATGNDKVDVMNMVWSSLAGEASPGLTLAGVAVLAALPPYKLLRQSSHGPARSAIGYLSGLLAGLAATAFLAIVVLGFANRSAVVEAGAWAAFFGPFVGMARAKWDGPRKSPRRSQIIRS
jgi:hypothetical protein